MGFAFIPRLEALVRYISHDTVVAVACAALLLGAVAIVYRQVAARKKASLTLAPHVLDFPPSRCHAMNSGEIRLETSEKGGIIRAQDIPPAVLRRRALPYTKTVDLTRNGLYTPTGFSTQDIKTLGRFPDYSLLSGVRHPQPCPPEFDIKRAIFRPFRPFRWQYHQHMGKCRSHVL